MGRFPPSLALLLLSLGTILATIIPTSIEYNYRTGDSHYTLWLSIGNPDRMYKLSLDFSHSELILFHDLSRISRSYSPAGSNDVVRFSELVQRLAIRLDPYRTEASTSCLGCDGILGASRDSPLWTIWPFISFSPGAIRFGELHPLLRDDPKCLSAVLPCNYTVESSICDIDARMAKVNGRHAKVVFSYDTHTILPYWAYQSHIEGHNIYDGSSGARDGKSWRPIRVEIDRLKPESDHASSVSSIEHQGYRWRHCAEEGPGGRWVFLIRGEQLVSPVNVGVERHLLVGHHDEDTLIIGIDIWRHLIVHKDNIHQVMVVRSFATQSHLSDGNIFMLFVIFYLFIKRKMDPHVLGQPWQQAWYSMVLQVVSVPIIAIAFGLQSTRLIMDDFRTIYLITGVSLLVFVLVQLAVVFRFFGIHEYMRNTVNNIGHEAALLITMWILLLERRTDDISTFLTAAISVFLIYEMAHFIITIGIYYQHVRPGGRSITPSTHPLYHIFLLVFVPGIFIWQVVASYIWFMRPFLVRALADLDSRLTDIVLVVIILFVINTALYISWLFVRKGILSSVNAKERAIFTDRDSK